jgi:hypothetical protein
MGPEGARNQNNYAGQAQHQFTELAWTELAANMGLNLSMSVGHEANSSWPLKGNVTKR